jgi:hypothetical protein
MAPARVKHLLWYEVWGSLEVLVIVFGWSICCGGRIGSDFIAPAIVIASLFGLLGAAYAYYVERLAARDLIRFPLWLVLGLSVGVRITGGYSVGSVSAEFVSGIALGGIIVSILAIGWITLQMEAPIPGEHGLCTECGYDMSHCTTRICPECGHENQHIHIEPQWGDRWYRPWRARK